MEPDSLKITTDRETRRMLRDAWFEGMKQGVMFDREDAHTIETDKPTRRMSFEEWYQLYFTEDE